MKRWPCRYADVLLTKESCVVVTYEKRQSVEGSEYGHCVIVRTGELLNEGVMHIFDVLW